MSSPAITELVMDYATAFEVMADAREVDGDTGRFVRPDVVIKASDRELKNYLAQRGYSPEVARGFMNMVVCDLMEIYNANPEDFDVQRRF